jgi:hypothetical protein
MRGCSDCIHSTEVWGHKKCQKYPWKEDTEGFPFWDSPCCEQRHYERRMLKYMEVTYSDGRRCSSVELQDISKDGCRLRTPTPLPPGVKVSVILPMSPPVKKEGEIRWCRKESGLFYWVGVKFLRTVSRRNGMGKEVARRTGMGFLSSLGGCARRMTARVF